MMETYSFDLPKDLCVFLYSLASPDVDIEMRPDLEVWCLDNAGSARLEPVVDIRQLTRDGRHVSVVVTGARIVFDTLEEATLFKLSWL